MLLGWSSFALLNDCEPFLKLIDLIIFLGSFPVSHIFCVDVLCYLMFFIIRSLLSLM